MHRKIKIEHSDEVVEIWGDDDFDSLILETIEHAKSTGWTWKAGQFNGDYALTPDGEPALTIALEKRGDSYYAMIGVPDNFVESGSPEAADAA